MASQKFTSNQTFSAGFYNQECCFTAQNLPLPDKEVNIPLSVNITEKMLFRGLPTNPSSYLAKELEKRFPGKSHQNTDLPAFVSKNDPKWKIRIKGDPNNPKNNPAKDFFEKLIPKYLGKYPYLKQLILPECPWEWIITNPLAEEELSSKPQQIGDFFLDIADLMIEVDGRSHNKKTQKAFDKNRDDILSRRRIKTVRIKTTDINNESEVFKNTISELISYLDSREELKNYQNSFENELFLKESYENIATAIIRFQIILIELIKRGKLNPYDPIWKITVETDVKSSFNWAVLACEDLFEWILPVSDIYDEKIKKPKFNIQLYPIGETKNKDGITIDFKLFDRWDETNLSDKISVRSDYVNSERFPQPDNKKNDIKKENRDNYINNSIPRLPALDPYRDISDALKKFTFQLFGFNSFKEGQFEIINHILTAKRTLGLLPTGGGKSLCFHLTASLVEGCCLVIAPIIALMNDQEEELKQMGFTGRVVSLSSQLKPWERDYQKNKINEGKVQFAFVSPERCQQPEFRDLLQNIEIGSVVVDEVHCLSEWGHDFRLSYLCLPQTLKKLFSDKPIICLTATASINVLRDIQNEFELENEDIVYRMNIIRDELGFRVLNPAERPELGFEVFDLDIEKKEALFQLLASLINEKNWINSKSAGIIFTPTIDNQKGCYFIQKELDRKFPNIKTGLFCGRKPEGFKVVDSAARSKFGSQPADFTSLKTYYQKEFKNNNLDLMCCTKAFGMGVNKPNIRCTIHFGTPSSMEALFQEGGRAGRDGENAKCYILFTPEKVTVPDWVHVASTTVEELETYLKTIPRGEGGDFQTQLFFLNSGIENIETELKICLKILDLIEKDSPKYCNIIESKLDKTFTSKKMKTEKAIFRLFQLGVVSDWMVLGYGEKSAFRVVPNQVTPKEMASSLENYISKYEKSPAKRKSNKEKIDNIVLQNEEENLREELLRFLLQWNYDNFAYYRRQSLKNVMDACLGYKDTGPEFFKQKLDDYFRLDEFTLDIEKLLEANAYESIQFARRKIAPNSQINPITEIEKTQNVLARYLESQKDNPGLDLLSGMCRLVTNKFDDADGASRLINFIKISQKDTDYWDEAFEDLLKLVSKLESKYKDQFSAEVCPYLENRLDLVKVHEYLDDDFSVIAYLEQYNKQLERVV